MAETVNKPVEDEKSPEEVSYYLVNEEGGSIKMYHIEGEKAKVIKSEEISVDVLPEDDILLLSQGIKFKSEDEAMAVWENFIS